MVFPGISKPSGLPGKQSEGIVKNFRFRSQNAWKYKLMVLIFFSLARDEAW